MSRAVLLGLVLLLAILPTIQVTRAQFSNPTPLTQVILDKSSYYPGDAGTISIDIKDTLAVNIVIYNLTITFPWNAYINGHWDGNQTTTLNGSTGTSIASGSWLTTVRMSFTVPTDSRYFVSPYYFGGGYQGQISVWASGVGPSGGPGKFSNTFYFPSAYFTTGFEWHTITYILIVMTILVGIMTGSVVYYVRSSLRQKRTSSTATPPTSSTLHLEG